jgi:hypothetical protein
MPRTPTGAVSGLVEPVRCPAVQRHIKSEPGVFIASQWCREIGANGPFGPLLMDRAAGILGTVPIIGRSGGLGMDFWQHARHLSTFNFIWRRIMKIKAISSAVLAALSLVALPAVAASNSLTYQGVTFETTDLGFGTLELTMTGANAATGNWSGVTLLQAFEIKNIGTVTSANIIDPPGSFAANLTRGPGCQRPRLQYGWRRWRVLLRFADRADLVNVLEDPLHRYGPEFLCPAPQGTVPYGCDGHEADRQPPVAEHPAGPGARNLRDDARRNGSRWRHRSPAAGGTEERLTLFTPTAKCSRRRRLRLQSQGFATYLVCLGETGVALRLRYAEPRRGACGSEQPRSLQRAKSGVCGESAWSVR